jgi:hypothetical protein
MIRHTPLHFVVPRTDGNIDGPVEQAYACTPGSTSTLLAKRYQLLCESRAGSASFALGYDIEFSGSVDLHAMPFV